MTWDDAINAAKSDPTYDLSTLPAEAVAHLFESKVPADKLEKAIEDLKQITATNETNAKKFANVMSIINTVVAIGKIALV